MATPNDVADIIEPLLDELLHKDINWFTVEFAPVPNVKNKYELKFDNKGSGGLDELKGALTANDRIFYGSLKIDLVDGNGSKYDKYIYFKYLPNKANKTKRGLWGWENPIKTAFKFKHVTMEYLDENLTNFDEVGISKEFLRVSENQMEYNTIDFGGGNVYEIKTGNVKKSRPKDMDNPNPNYNNNNNNNDDEKDANNNDNDNNNNNDDNGANDYAQPPPPADDTNDATGNDDNYDAPANNDDDNTGDANDATNDDAGDYDANAQMNTD